LHAQLIRKLTLCRVGAVLVAIEEGDLVLEGEVAAHERLASAVRARLQRVARSVNARLRRSDAACEAAEARAEALQVCGGGCK